MSDVRTASADGVTDRIASREIAFWLDRVTAHGAGPTVSEIQASLSWRITEPLRRVQVRKRIASLRSGSFGRIQSTEDGPADGGPARSALIQRLFAVAPHLLSAPPAGAEAGLGSLLTRMLDSTRRSEDLSALWLLSVAISGCFPDDAFVIALARDLEGASPAQAVTRILHHCAVWTERYGSERRRIRVVSDDVLAIVDFTRRFGFNSGVQRVTRETMSHWSREGRSVELAAFVENNTALRELHETERRFVLEWDQTMSSEVNDLSDDGTMLLVPWKTTVLLPELLAGHAAITMRAVAQYSGNRCVAIGYDTIPLSSGRSVQRAENHKFATYLAMIKHFDEVIAISESAAEEFAGYVAAVSVQGLPGPRVTSVTLPLEPIPESADGVLPSEAAPVSVLTVGSNEPRKNQLAVVVASERLWREGHEFELVIVGGRGDRFFTEVSDGVRALRAQGRSIRIVRDASEDALACAYRAARFSVFVSTHEGYGLPVAESLAVGTPVVATGYGSAAEIARGGGCLLVDPRDDDQIVEAMRSLLEGDDELVRLTEEIHRRPVTTWRQYADAIADVVFTEGAR